MSESDAVASAGIRPWLSCVLVGIVLLALAPALLRSPEDGIAIQDSGAVREAPGVSLANPAPPQSPGPASKLSAREGDTLPDLKALLSTKATREDHEAILTTDSPALNFAKDEARSCRHATWCSSKASRRTRPDQATTRPGSGTASRRA